MIKFPLTLIRSRCARANLSQEAKIDNLAHWGFFGYSSLLLADFD